MSKRNIVIIIVLVVSISLIVVGFMYKKDYESNPKDNKKQTNTPTEVNKINSAQDALDLLNRTYIIEEPNQYYSYVSENDEDYLFEVTNSNDGKIYVVRKKTAEIFISYRLQ